MIYVVYHSPCFDGFGAAFSAWKKLGYEFEGQKVVYLGTTYKKPLPFNVEDLSKEDTMYVVDFCFTPEQVLDVKAKVGKLMILDHHITHKECLEGMGDISHFDMNKSGAMITWEYFHPGQEAPNLIKYIQDRDIWTHKIPDSKYLYGSLNILDLTFETWDGLLNEDSFNQAIEQGKLLYKVKQKEVDEVKAKAFPCTFEGVEVLAVNSSSVHISDILNELLVDNPDIPFTVGFHYDKHSVKYSLRSRGQVFTEGVLNYDTATLCKKYQGGGHRNASGMHMTSQPLPFPLNFL